MKKIAVSLKEPDDIEGEIFNSEVILEEISERSPQISNFIQLLSSKKISTTYASGNQQIPLEGSPPTRT